MTVPTYLNPILQEPEDGWLSQAIEQGAYQTFYRREAHRMALETQMVFATIGQLLYKPAPLNDDDIEDEDGDW